MPTGLLMSRLPQAVVGLQVDLQGGWRQLLQMWRLRAHQYRADRQEAILARRAVRLVEEAGLEITGLPTFRMPRVGWAERRQRWHCGVGNRQ